MGPLGLEVMGRLGDNAPSFFHVNWFRKDAAAKGLWPGFGENLRPLLWALDRAEGKDNYVDTPMGRGPAADALDRRGLDAPAEKLEALLSYDPLYGKNESERRARYLAELEAAGVRMPAQLNEAHRRFVAAVQARKPLGGTSRAERGWAAVPVPEDLVPALKNHGLDVETVEVKPLGDQAAPQDLLDQLAPWLARTALPDDAAVREELARWVPEYQPR